ncbi:hypothetical protein [Gemmatimonas phototrophica]|uniref:Uncharacterized protein n=1 Tax=Gemmatimonas phototrophica TaxID=1379270 RepID=A0A143BMM3_9BACT|nr:hypothetical protein [Gemmatimonas phototrophica]AMW05711.1 hypothetical protein GEMMAAP_14705 [Gemmatimonas phototrophica]
MRAQLAERLLLSVGAPPAFVDDVLGDLEEERVHREALGLGPQNRWFVRQILAAMPYAIGQGLRTNRLRGVLRLLETSLAAWMVVTIATAIPMLVVAGVYSTMSGEQLSRFAARLPLWPGLALGLLSAAAVGYTAAWLDRHRPLLVSLTSGVVWAGIQSAVMLANIGQTAAWQWALPFINFVAVSVGGLYRMSRHAPAGESVSIR